MWSDRDPVDQVDVAWREGLRTLAPKSPADPARIMAMLSRRARRRGAVRASVAAAAVLMVVGLANIPGEPNTVTAMRTEGSAETLARSLTTTSVRSPTSTSMPAVADESAPTPTTQPGRPGRVTPPTSGADISRSPGAGVANPPVAPPPGAAAPAPDPTTTTTAGAPDDPFDGIGKIDVVLQVGSFTVSPASAPAGMYRIVLDGSGFPNRVRPRLHISAPDGTEMWVLQPGHLMYKKLLCPGRWTLRITEDIVGPEITAPIFVDITGRSPDCTSAP